VKIYTRIKGVTQVNAKLSRLGRELGNDLSVPNRAVSVALYGWVMGNFDSQGGKIGGWEPLAPATVARKMVLGKEQMLVISGALRNSFVPGQFYDARRAGVGSAIPYSIYHEDGNTRMPRRQLLPDEETSVDIAMRVYKFYVDKAVRAAQ
jgi:phage gpG-like protein